MFLYDHAVEQARWTSLATVKGHVYAIRWHHRQANLPDPTADPLVKGLMAHLRARMGTAPQNQRTPARPDHALKAMTSTGAQSKRRRSGTALLMSRTRAALHLSAALHVTPGRVRYLSQDNVQLTSDAIQLPVFGTREGLVPEQTLRLGMESHADLIRAVKQWMEVAATVAPDQPFNQPTAAQDSHAVHRAVYHAVRTCAGQAGIATDAHQRPWTWTRKEFDRALECVDPAWREHRRTGAYLLIGLGLALRDASLRSITREGVAWTGAYYRVEVPHYKFGNGERVRSVHHTAGHPPTCPSCALDRWLEVRGDRPGPLFTAFDRHSATDRLVTQKTARRALVDLLDNAGVQGRWGTHSLRRGFISAAVDAGMPPEWIQGVTSHKSIDEILRYFDEADLRSLPSPLDAA
ncbi:tyrosine-type recombinase/integrase [Pedococcus sp. KACC 23699]|uniref:Tyrosine-type recombinase/integrase n=1 Tax=Pedococcus sp. KACC 23699 TaxID=3149228 RepID=A0AAU7JYS8_9MICO